MFTHNGNLHIKSISNKNLDLGFWCQVKSKLTGETFLSQSAGRVILTDPQGGVAPVIIDIIESVSIESGETLKLPCAAQGSPPPTYRWTSKNYEKIASKNSTLSITHTQEAGSYIYSCIVENKFGVDKKNTKVIIRGTLFKIFLK